MRLAGIIISLAMLIVASEGRDRGGHYRIRLDGQWIDVPDDALITVPNRVGRTMVWPMPMIEGDTIKIRCFMPGSMIKNRTAKIHKHEPTPRE